MCIAAVTHFIVCPTISFNMCHSGGPGLSSPKPVQWNGDH